MKLSGSIILTGFTSLLFIVGGVSPSYVHAVNALYDGPCSSEANALCQMSGRDGMIVITEERIATIKPAVVPKFALPDKKQIAAIVKANVEHWFGHRTRRDPNAWKMYLTTFKPVGISAMPASIHRLKDPFAANRRAQELLEQAPPVFKIIAACESRMKHYNEKTGNVLQGTTTPGDVGLLQINSIVHGETARKLGFNVWSIYGNIGYGVKLYIEEGTKPWNSSKKCWGPKVPPELRLPLPAQV